MRESLPSDLVCFLCGNKCDMQPAAIKPELAADYAQQENLSFFETSAKLGTGVNEMFEALASRLIDQAKNKAGKPKQSEKSKGTVNPLSEKGQAKQGWC